MLAAGCAGLGPAPPAQRPGGRPLAAAQRWYAAAAAGEVETLRQLLSADPRLLDRTDGSGWTALHYAAWEARIPALRFLLERGARPELHVLAATGDLPRLAAALEARPGAVNVPDGREKAPPLLWAARTGQEMASELLLNRGANPEGTDALGRTALHHAAAGGKLELCRLLIYRGVDPQARDRRGRTPLHAAAQAGEAEVCSLLLAEGADPDVGDAAGDTPLHLAAAGGRLSAAEVLLMAGAEVNPRDQEGLTPLAVAEREGRRRTAEMLRFRGGER